MVLLLHQLRVSKPTIALLPKIRAFPRPNSYRNSITFARRMASTTANITPASQVNGEDLSNIFTEEVSRDILDFWFAGASLYPAQEEAKRWFVPDTEFDEQCRSKFVSIISKVAAYPSSSIVSLATSPERALSLILLLDQFPRNIFRGELSAKVYTETDPLAVAVALHSLLPELRYDYGPNNAWKTVPSRRLWFALPLTHSEDLALHARVVEKPGMLEDCLAEEAKEGSCAGLVMTKTLEGHVVEHTNVIRRFGRYPYRNKVLGRETTPEEIEWLKNPVSWAR